MIFNREINLISTKNANLLTKRKTDLSSKSVNYINIVPLPSSDKISTKME
jgi:hypothetical protein